MMAGIQDQNPNKIRRLDSAPVIPVSWEGIPRARWLGSLKNQWIPGQLICPTKVKSNQPCHLTLTSGFCNNTCVCTQYVLRWICKHTFTQNERHLPYIQVMGKTLSYVSLLSLITSSLNHVLWFRSCTLKESGKCRILLEALRTQKIHQIYDSAQIIGNMHSLTLNLSFKF